MSNRVWKLVLAAVAAAVVVVISLVISSGPDRTDPQAVTTTFIKGVAVEDPEICELAVQEALRTAEKRGICPPGERRGGDFTAGPVVTVLQAVPCPAHAGLDVEVTPPLQSGKPFVHVRLVRVDDQWRVRSLLHMSDRNAIQPYQCASAWPPTSAGR
ncbi:hypothetical protein M8C13_07395 [Crossiella sp. SN42]|uniref:hypothetical protein n=1 Tax=Crossiella sp. SN42 TaxID=2944808 RepID=UPI00207CEDC2|nr:hypothetical protein [Crossiella sp. SN42]MCO1575582.1 hypothetical protein [Crossiella sp. SN42]